MSGEAIFRNFLPSIPPVVVCHARGEYLLVSDRVLLARVAHGVQGDLKGRKCRSSY